MMSSTQEELESAYKKAVKTLDGEKRAAIKKAKGTKGKKAKEALAQVEEEYATKLKDLETKHEQQLQELADGGGDDAPAAEQGNAAPDEPIDTTTTPEQEVEEEEELNPELSAKERKQEKARRKKERQKEKEAQKQKELEEEMANAGPSMRKIELDQIQSVLTPLNKKVAEVEADGHCLFRAVAAQTGRENYTEVRKCEKEQSKSKGPQYGSYCNTLLTQRTKLTYSVFPPLCRRPVCRYAEGTFRRFCPLLRIYRHGCQF
jgi:OTU domain-containing protein 6